jgi:hypothetical protein
MWEMSKPVQAIIEKRGAALGVGEVDWVRTNMRLFTKTYQMKGVDWLNMSRGAGIHIFDGFVGGGLPGPERENVVEAWESLLTAFHMCCVITCNVDGAKPTAEMLRRYTHHNAPSLLLFFLVLAV